MQLKMSRILLAAAFCGGLVLTACGGGGGNATATPIANPPVDGYPVEAGGPAVDGSAAATPATTIATESYPVP